MEVGPIPNDREEEMADTMRTNWACEILNRAHNSPFFLAVGFYAPHFPNYAPEKYFDLYPLDSIKRPAWKEDDLDDIPPIMRERHTVRKERIHNQLLKLGIVETTLQGYLACISYADAMVGRLLDSLAASRYRDDTIVVFWSDHGFTHGQKGHWGKHTLWERTSNVPFMWSGPRIPQGQTSNVTVSLVDIYPTLSEFCSLSPDPGLEGVSLVNTLKSLASAEDRYVLLPFDGPGSYAVISRNWRYIHYEDGTEELYDVVKDPNEWDNLAADARYARVKRKLESLGPDRFAPSATPASALRLVVEGETFRWVPKDPKKSEK
jgi:arylsulfatase A-like enzyme